MIQPTLFNIDEVLSWTDEQIAEFFPNDDPKYIRGILEFNKSVVYEPSYLIIVEEIEGNTSKYSTTQGDHQCWNYILPPVYWTYRNTIIVHNEAYGYELKKQMESEGKRVFIVVSRAPKPRPHISGEPLNDSGMGIMPTFVFVIVGLLIMYGLIYITVNY